MGDGKVLNVYGMVPKGDVNAIKGVKYASNGIEKTFNCKEAGLKDNAGA